MADFLLLLHRPIGGPPAFPPDRLAAITKDYVAWNERMRAEGRFKAGQKLTFDSGRVMRPNGGRIVVTDGPFAESKELLGGFYVVAARDYDEACKLAETCPHFKYGGSIEVRQIDVL